MLDNIQRTEQFKKEYTRILRQAQDLFLQRDESGRNAILSPYEMFPHGPSDVLGLLWIKVARALGNEKVGRWDLVAQEVIDLLNYSAFLLIVLEDQPQEQLTLGLDT